jgi:hypothetical protein
VSLPEDAVRAESALRRHVRSAAGLTILTGGQTGVDTYAAHAALRSGLPVHVIFPAGWRQEDGPLTPARRRRLAGTTMHELGEASFEYRTWTGVYVSDVVVLLDPAGGSGCRETALAAVALGRPLLEPEPGELTAESARDWLTRTGARVLLVAGCRASLLSRHRGRRTARSLVEVVMAGARLRHAELLGGV